MPSYRVFVSYSHEDLPLARQVVEVLQSLGLRAMWDQNFAFGDWFSAESLSGSQWVGYRQTVFARHAPNMQRRIDEFDTYMERLLEDAGVRPIESRRFVLEKIAATIADIGGRMQMPMQAP